MTLSLEEKEKLLNKAMRLYEEITNIKIRNEIKVANIETRYYSQTSRFIGLGCRYYTNGVVTIYGENIEDSLADLKNYINSKKDNQSPTYLSSYTIDALLDFIYNRDTILNTIKRVNEEERQTLNSLLD